MAQAEIRKLAIRIRQCIKDMTAELHHKLGLGEYMNTIRIVFIMNTPGVKMNIHE